MAWLIFLCPDHGAVQRQGPVNLLETIRCPVRSGFPPTPHGIDIPLRLYQRDGPILNEPKKNLPPTQFPMPRVKMTRVRRPWPSGRG